VDIRFLTLCRLIMLHDLSFFYKNNIFTNIGGKIRNPLQVVRNAKNVEAVTYYWRIPSISGSIR